MPYAYDPNEDENQQQSAENQNSPQLASGGQAFGGATNTSGGASNTAGGSGKPTSSGSFQNLNSYLDANSGSGFGNDFVGKVQGDISQATKAQGDAANQFKQASDAGAVKQNDSVLNNTLNDPYGVSNDPNQKAAFQSQLQATYKGPQSYSDDQAAFQSASGATQKAKDTANAAQTEGGRFALLDNYFGNPNYSQGQKGLDNLLLQGDPTTQQGIKQATQNANQAQIDFQNQAPGLQQYAANNNAMTQATAKNAQTQGTNAITQMQDAYKKALTDAQTNGGANYQQNLTDLQGLSKAGGANPNAFQLAKDLGIPTNSVDGFTGYWGVNPGNYYSQNSAPDISSVTTLAQQQKLNALQGLMGSAQDPFTASEAGTYNPAHPGTFDPSGYSQAQKTNMSLFDNSYKPISSKLQNDQAALAAAQAPQNGNGLHADPAAAQALVYADEANINNLLGQYGMAPAYAYTGGPKIR